MLFVVYALCHKMVPWFTKEQVLIQFRIKAALVMYKTAVSPATVDIITGRILAHAIKIQLLELVARAA